MKLKSWVLAGLTLLLTVTNVQAGDEQRWRVAMKELMTPMLIAYVKMKHTSSTVIGAQYYDIYVSVNKVGPIPVASTVCGIMNTASGARGVVVTAAYELVKVPEYTTNNWYDRTTLFEEGESGYTQIREKLCKNLSSAEFTKVRDELGSKK